MEDEENRFGFVPPSRHNPLHEERVDFINTIAILSGCTTGIGAVFPDGRRPDVLRVNLRDGILFVGDAKNTETPKSTKTQGRLLSYLLWLRSNVAGGHRKGVFTLCYGRDKDTRGWIRVVIQLGRSIGLVFSDLGVLTFNQDTKLVWFVCNSTG